MKSLRLKLRFTDVPISPTPGFTWPPSVDRVVFLGRGNNTGDPETLLFYVEGDREAFKPVLTSGLQIEDYDISPGRGDAFFLYVRATMGDLHKSLMETFHRETVVSIPPIEFRSDRTMRLTVIGESDELQAAIDELPAGIDVDILRIGGYTDAFGGRLTDRQHEALTVAWTIGYYAVPREGDLAAVADELGCATSTASDILRRAEAQLVADTLGKGL